nr:MAG TPA: hypothetical protein [Caudoviricetes sp.]
MLRYIVQITSKKQFLKPLNPVISGVFQKDYPLC